MKATKKQAPAVVSVESIHGTLATIDAAPTPPLSPVTSSGGSSEDYDNFVSSLISRLMSSDGLDESLLRTQTRILSSLEHQRR